MKFASFENIVAAIYNYLPGTKNDYGKGAQTAVAFTGGYMAGILCAIVSHPADVMVSKLNADRAPGEAFGAAMSRIYGKIGFSGLWNGLPVRIVMIGTLTGLQVSTLTCWTLVDTDNIVVDDIRFIQDLHGTTYNWFRWREEGDCQSVESELPKWIRWTPVCAYEINHRGFGLLSYFPGGVRELETVSDVKESAIKLPALDVISKPLHSEPRLCEDFAISPFGSDPRLPFQESCGSVLQLLADPEASSRGQFSHLADVSESASLSHAIGSE